MLFDIFGFPFVFPFMLGLDDEAGAGGDGGEGGESGGEGGEAEASGEDGGEGKGEEGEGGENKAGEEGEGKGKGEEGKGPLAPEGFDQEKWDLIKDLDLDSFKDMKDLYEEISRDEGVFEKVKEVMKSKDGNATINDLVKQLKELQDWKDGKERSEEEQKEAESKVKFETERDSQIKTEAEKAGIKELTDMDKKILNAYVHEQFFPEGKKSDLKGSDMGKVVKEAVKQLSDYRKTILSKSVKTDSSPDPITNGNQAEPTPESHLKDKGSRVDDGVKFLQNKAGE